MAHHLAHDPAQDLVQDPAHDPAYDGTSIPIPWPSLSGLGSDRGAWVAFAREVALSNEEAWEVVDEQGALVGRLEAKVARLRAQLAEREPAENQPVAPELTKLDPAEREPAESKPKGGRRKTSEDMKEAILADLAAGLSQSQAARCSGVSAMTVSRLARSA